MFKHFDTKPACDGRMDGQDIGRTSCNNIVRTSRVKHTIVKIFRFCFRKRNFIPFPSFPFSFLFTKITPSRWLLWLHCKHIAFFVSAFLNNTQHRAVSLRPGPLTEMRTVLTCWLFQLFPRLTSCGANIITTVAPIAHSIPLNSFNTSLSATAEFVHLSTALGLLAARNVVKTLGN